MFLTFLSLLLLLPLVFSAALSQDEKSLAIDRTFTIETSPSKLVEFSQDMEFGTRLRTYRYIITAPQGYLVQATCDLNMRCAYGSGLFFFDNKGGLEATECLSQEDDKLVQTGFYYEPERMAIVAVADFSVKPRFTCAVIAVKSAAPAPTTTLAPIVKPITPTSPCKCGQSSINKIISGSRASLGEIPWQISFQKVLNTNGASSSICGGTLINNEWVLTAAHCLIPPQLIRILLGTIDSTRGGMMVTPSAVIGHPYYGKTSHVNDIALIKLSEKVPINQYIFPACLPRVLEGETFKGATLQISGWGLTSEEGRPSRELLKAAVVGISNEECARVYGPRSINKGSLCATYPKTDTCQGDSGGPLSYKHKGLNYIVGVVSFGNGCARPGYPGVYARVTTYLRWIDYVTGGSVCSI